MPAPPARRRTARAEACHVGSVRPPSARAAARLRRSSWFSIRRRKRCGQRGHIVGRHQQAGPGRHRVRDRAGGGADDRQAVRESLGIGHAEALEARGQHEQVGPGIERRNRFRGEYAQQSHARLQGQGARCRRRARPRRPDRGRGRRQWRASRAGRRASPSAAISTSKPLRGTMAPTDTSRTTPSRLPGAGAARSVPGGATVMRAAATP